MINDWVHSVLRAMEVFAENNSVIYSKSDRELHASFEIGCFLALIDYYEKANCKVVPKGLHDVYGYRYLTTPSGNPDNFSYIELQIEQQVFELRQQVRIVSHIHPDIAFTPDIIVIKNNDSLRKINRDDYGNRKRRFFYVEAKNVIAAHECKSLEPFPELLVSFIGHLVIAHEWLESPNDRSMILATGTHLAPTLFTGGIVRGYNIRMVESLRETFPINIIVGLHAGTWDLYRNDLARLKDV